LKYREKAAATGKPVFLVFEHWKYPMRLSAWYVDRVPDINDPNQINTVFQKDPANHLMPNNVQMAQVCQEGIASFSTIPAGTPYEPLLTALCTDPAPGYQFASQGDPNAKRAFIFVFLPAGAVMIIGKANVPSFSLDAKPPTNGDIVIENEDSRLFIDVNPITGKVRWAQDYNLK
ncbi:MAG: hypothetical protein AB7S36_19825, partial [Planctomycetota bacterium]